MIKKNKESGRSLLTQHSASGNIAQAQRLTMSCAKTVDSLNVCFVLYLDYICVYIENNAKRKKEKRISR
jgi:hypothetical protein